ncbi:MAG: tetratricopeptide repeat protein [Roseimicrobium sp.]
MPPKLPRSTQALLAALCLIPLVAYGHGSYHEELETVDEHLAQTPNDGRLWYRRAFLNVLHGEWQMAMVDAEKADRLAPGAHPTDWVRGQALDTGGQFAVARAVLDAFLEKHPSHGGAYASRARVLMKLGEKEAALADYRTALQFLTKAEPDMIQETVQVLLNQNLDSEAADLLEAHIKRLGDEPGLVLTALDADLRLGRYDSALKRVDAMERTAPRPEPWMARRAQILAQAGHTSQARSAWEALAAHIQSLPNLERGSPHVSKYLLEAQQALGLSIPAPVVAPPRS